MEESIYGCLARANNFKNGSQMASWNSYMLFIYFFINILISVKNEKTLLFKFVYIFVK